MALSEIPAKVCPPITVWRFEDAPPGLLANVNHDDDAEWFAELPDYFDDLPDWMESGGAFGRCTVTLYPHPFISNWHVAVGYHA